MDWEITLIMIIVIIMILYMILYSKITSKTRSKSNSRSNLDHIEQIELSPDQEYLVNLSSVWFPKMNRDDIISSVIRTTRSGSETNQCSWTPKFTFPIEGICRDGELVSDVLKRLELEGNQNKMDYFKAYMGIKI